MQVQQKPPSSDVSVTGKLSKLTVRDSVNERDNDEDDETGQSDHPVNKKNKSGSGRSRRRRKGRRGDAAAAVNMGVTCEFVQGGGGKMHSSVSSQRRDWFAVDASDKHTGLFDSVSATNVRRGSDDKDRRDSADRKKATLAPALEASSKFDRSGAGAMTSQGKESSRSIRSASKLSDASPSAGGRKSALSASKELSGNKRQVAAQRNAMSASASDMQLNKAKPLTESGQTCQLQRYLLLVVTGLVKANGFLC